MTRLVAERGRAKPEVLWCFDTSRLKANWPAAPFDDEEGGVSIAATAGGLDAIGRLRYELYIERDGKAYECANHELRTFVEPVDTASLNFQAVRDGKLLAAVRLTKYEDALHDPHLALLAESACHFAHQSVVLNSRFVVRSEMRGRALVTPLFQRVYQTGLQAAAEYCLAATRDSLVGIFERFGFRRDGGEFDDPVAGRMHVVALQLHDFEHLRQVRSPLWAIAEEFPHLSEARRV